MTGDAVLRWIRVLALASLLFVCGLAGHVAAGGFAPTTPVLIPLFVVTVVAVTQFVGAPSSPARVAVLLVGGQGLLHAALQLGGSSHIRANHLCGAASDVAGMSAPTSAHHVTHLGVAASHHCATSLVGGSTQLVMLLAHLTAGLVVAMWLAAGERALWTLLTFTVRPVVYAWRTVTDVARKVIGAASRRFARSQPGWVPRYPVRSLVRAASVVSRRGPPTVASLEPSAYAAASTV